jgi:hypothetical protein
MPGLHNTSKMYSMVFLDVVLTRLCECWFLGLGKVSNPSISSNTGIMVLVGVLDILQVIELRVNCWYSFPYIVGDFEDLVAKTDVHISLGHRLEVLQGMEQECMTALSISCLQRYTHNVDMCYHCYITGDP